MSDSVATGSVATGAVATGSVATGLVALGGVATGCVAVNGAPAGGVATGLVAVGTLVGGAAATGCVAARLVAAGRDAGACRAERRVALGAPAVKSAGEGSVGTVVVVVADGTVAPVDPPAGFPRPTSGVTEMSTREGGPAGAGDAGVAGAAGVTTCTSCCGGVAEPVAGGPFVGLDTPPLAAAMVTRRSARELRFESAAVRVPSTRLRVPVSDGELLPTSIGEPEAPFDAVVEAIVPASAAFAQTPEANTLAVAIRPKN